MAEKKKCFIISPIGEDGSSERADADWFREIVNESLGDEFEIQRADNIAKTDLITNQIIQAIETADLIVADLTNHNPNVHYELGVAHAQRKHVVPMISKGQRLPFDNLPVRTIFYSRVHPQDVREAVRALKQAAKDELSGEVHNPVTLALGVQKLQESADPRDRVIADLTRRIDRLANTVDSITRRPLHPDELFTLTRQPWTPEERLSLALKYLSHSEAVALYNQLYDTLTRSERAEFDSQVEALEQAKDPISFEDRAAILRDLVKKRPRE